MTDEIREEIKELRAAGVKIKELIEAQPEGPRSAHEKSLIDGVQSSIYTLALEADALE